MIRIAVAGLGKMGLSHLSIFRANPDVELVAVCDSSGYVLDVLGKYTGLATFTDYATMLEQVPMDAVVIATPSHLHGSMVRAALDRGISVFCEKPFCLDDTEGQSLQRQAAEAGLVTQVGYHNRYVASFAELQRLVTEGAIGTVTHVLAEAYGPVVLKAKGGTWRSQKSAGGGALYDYAAHPVDLLTWCLGEPDRVAGSSLTSIFSKEIDDQVNTTLHFPGGATAQLSVNWSDESQRKMATKLTVWGTRGRIYADRQEIQVYLRDLPGALPDGYGPGWTVRYTTELTEPVGFYLRGEEYTAQAEDFVRRVAERDTEGRNTFQSASRTDRILTMIQSDAAGIAATATRVAAAPAARRPRPRLRAALRRLRDRVAS